MYKIVFFKIVIHFCYFVNTYRMVLMRKIIYMQFKLQFIYIYIINSIYVSFIYCKNVNKMLSISCRIYQVILIFKGTTLTYKF